MNIVEVVGGRSSSLLTALGILRSGGTPPRLRPTQPPSPADSSGTLSRSGGEGGEHIPFIASFFFLSLPSPLNWLGRVALFAQADFIPDVELAPV